MQVEVKLDASYAEPKVLILTASMSEEIETLLGKLSDPAPQVLSGSKDGKLEILAPEDLIRIYASGGKVFALTGSGEYVLRLRLYEVEARLDPRQFVRISNAEIIHLKKVDHFDLSFTGTICVKLSGGTTTYVSRRYVPKIKKILGV